MRVSRILGVASISISFLIVSCHGRATNDIGVVQSHSRIPLKRCKVANGETEALCASYEVWEDREARSGRKISLNIIVFPAESKSSAPDPVFWFEGGPGGAATEMAGPAITNPLVEIGKYRDVILVDQRGTGGSNYLQCDFGESPSDLAIFFGELFPLDKVRACREKLEKIANLAMYTTPIAMEDLDEVREALGYDKINLAGMSYGTFAAQIYLRQHPEHVRAVFLSGVATPAIRQPLLFARAAQNALDYLIVDCAADEKCHAAYPNLKNEFSAVISHFHEGPVSAELIDNRTGQKKIVKITRESFVEHIRLALYATRTARYVPEVIHHAYENDFLPFESLSISSNPGSSLARGMYMSVTCSEGVPFITEALLTQETKGTFVGDRRVRAQMEACKEWPRGKIPPDYINLVDSSAPVLMISGEVDGATPPWFGEEALKHFPNGRQVKVRYMGHEGNQCERSIFNEFIKSGSSAGLDASCTSSIRRPAFLISGPVPSRF